MTATTARIQLLTVPDCPLADRAQAAIDHALTALTGATEAVEELVGAYPSPTVLVDGLDVVTGAPPATGACCRLGLPTAAQITAALTRSTPQLDSDRAGTTNDGNL